MSDEPQSNRQEIALVDQNFDNRRSGYKNYSDEDKYTALAALDINGGNVYRTAIAYNIPYSTLRAWAQEREARGVGPSKLEIERRGSLAAKIEDKLHLTVESVTAEVVQKATLSQRGVFIGILADKLRMIRERAEADPAVELARILGCSVSQLPPTLQLGSGGEIVESPIFETKPDPDGAYEVENPSPSADVNPTEESGQAPIDSDESESIIEGFCD